MSALCLYVSGLNVAHPPVKLATPLQGGGENSQGGGENFRLASLAICHPPDQNAETASGLMGILSYKGYALFIQGKGTFFRNIQNTGR